MAKIMTVAEALEEIRSTKRNKKNEIVPNRFNKKNFNMLMVALANDTEFTSKVVKNKKGSDEIELEDVMVTKGFRKWCKKLVEKLGVDSAESEIIMSPDFEIDNMDGLYEFFATAVYEYMDAGNRFDLPSKEDFKGSFYLKEIDEIVKTSETFNPADHTSLGIFETKKKKHKELKVKSSTPAWLSEKRKIK